jgi:hypothetical protein
MTANIETAGGVRPGGGYGVSPSSRTRSASHVTARAKWRPVDPEPIDVVPDA